MIGVININKPLGMTSHDVVSRLRKILGIKKIGHTGTLDPDATGVLPMCIGKATKLADMLTANDKQYIAEVTLGVATDTLDKSGEVTETAEVNVTLNDIKACLNEFKGEITQIPPMYSAIKVNGKKLCDLARKGENIERQPRKVQIDEIEIIDTDLENNKFSIRVDCSKGTYIRTLCDDIGKKLGCFAHMSALERTKSGRFSISDTYTIDDIENMYLNNDLSFLISLEKILDDYPKIVLTQKKAKVFSNGTQVSVQGVDNGAEYTVFDENGTLLALARADAGKLVILKAFYG